MTLRIRRALPGDAAAACGVLRRSIEDCCRLDHGDDPALLQAWLRNKTPDFVHGLIVAPDGFPLVAERQGVVIGFALSSGSGEIQLCYVVPEVLWTGVGKALLAAMERHAAAAGVATLRLESSRTALPFYTRHGFTASGPSVTVFGLQAQPMHKPCVAPRHGD